MATDALRHGSRAAKQQAEQAAKDRRAKIMLAIGGVLLLVVLVIEVPKMLGNLHKAPAQPVATTPVPTTPSVTSPTGAHAADLKAVDKFAAKDPFVAQVGTKADTIPALLAATPPAVRTSAFVRKDPFVQQLTPSAAAPGVAPVAQPASKSGAGGSYGSKGAKGSTASAGGGYIVMVASVPVASGRAAAEREAVNARARGIANVKIVVSSNYPTLREGFFAVYSGPYSSLSRALVVDGSRGSITFVPRSRARAERPLPHGVDSGGQRGGRMAARRRRGDPSMA